MRKIRNLSDKPFIGPLVKMLIGFIVDREVKGIAKHFSTYLAPKIAIGQSLRDSVLNIRHKVYCEELQFEPERDDRKESDEFDSYAEYCLIEQLSSGRFAGCVRMVTPVKEDDLLPIEKYCINSITNEEYHPQNFTRDKLGEISRLAVLPDFRRRNTDKFKGAEVGAINTNTYSEAELRCFPFISIGLYFSVAALTILKGRWHIYVMTEPRIARSMSLAGIKFIQIGPTVDYHGKRAPYYINPDILLEHMSPGLKFLFNAIKKAIGKQLKNRKNT